MTQKLRLLLHQLPTQLNLIIGNKKIHVKENE